MAKKVFLGGTCNKSMWRENIVIPQLTIDYFNPVVPEWNEEARLKEIAERENDDYCLYVITPKQTGFYSFAEVADDSDKRPEKTVFAYIEKDVVVNEDGTETEVTFTPDQMKSLKAISKLVNKNGGHAFDTIQECIDFLNQD